MATIKLVNHRWLEDWYVCIFSCLTWSYEVYHCMDIDEIWCIYAYISGCWFKLWHFSLFSTFNLLLILFSLKNWVLLPEDKYNKRLGIVPYNKIKFIVIYNMVLSRSRQYNCCVSPVTFTVVEWGLLINHGHSCIWRLAICFVLLDELDNNCDDWWIILWHDMLS
jgi:hypothetical protein